MSAQDYHHFIEWFRQTTPYINTHRGHTFVLMISGETVAHANFARIVQDIALLNSLGVRLVLIHGSRPQIDARLQKTGVTPRYHQQIRITDGEILPAVQEAAGSVRVQIEAQLSKIAHRAAQHKNKLRVVGGNFVTAKPLGVIEGVDFCQTGSVRRVDAASISHFLNDGAIVLISHLGYSPSGDVFNLSVEEVASEVAISLNTDKIIFYGTQSGWLDETQQLVREITMTQAKNALITADYSEQKRLLSAALHACSNGVPRAHLISYQQDGALLQELFTHDGCGTLVMQADYEQMRTAILEDIDGIIDLIRPLEAADILVHRSRERIEDEINHFVVCERDGLIIGCAALYPLPDKASGEVACVAVHPHYRNHHRGDHLLHFLEKRAKELYMTQLFVLTTQTAHWFVERGFCESNVDELPKERQSLYNFQRNSKVFKKVI